MKDGKLQGGNDRDEFRRLCSKIAPNLRECPIPISATIDLDNDFAVFAALQELDKQLEGRHPDSWTISELQEYTKLRTALVE